MPETRVIAVVGPTATGKTALGVALGKLLGGEVVSGDSRQVYRGLDLGTGKVTAEEARGVPHHCIDIADPRVQYTVADFVRDGRAAIAAIAARGKLPIVVGGSGLYIDALLGRLSLNAPLPTPGLRARVSMSDIDTLKAELSNADPERYARTDLKNRRRVERALEIALSPVVHPPVDNPEYDVTWIGLTLERESLKTRIHTRLIDRLNEGMLDEARVLHAHGLSYERMEELGLEYRYLARHLQGLISYDDMVSALEREIYKYAKRQMTWFKRNTNITWLDAEGPNVLEQALAVVHL